MELRGCSHLHFISVIRGDEVIKVPNISREKKVLKFKNVPEIYFSSASNCNDFLAKIPPKVDRSLAIHYGCDGVKTEVKIESTEEESQLDFGAITLKQLRKTCKSKKRKASKSDNITAVKHEVNDLQLEDELELKETLGSWKRKLFKKKKGKRNGTTKCAFISSNTNGLGGRSIPNDLVSCETSEEIFTSVRIKIEETEAQPDYSQPQAISCILSDAPESIRPIMAIQGAVNSCCTDRGIKTTLETQSCSLNRVSYEPLETQCLSLSQVSHEHVESFQLRSPLISEDYKCEDVTELDSAAVTSNHPPVLPVSELRKGEDMTDLLTCDEAPEKVILECDNPGALCVLPCRSESMEVEVPGPGPGNSCQNVEFIDNDKASGYAFSNKNLAAEVIRTVRDGSSTVKSIECLPSANDFGTRDTVKSTVEDKELSTLDTTAVPFMCSPEILPYDDSSKFTESPANESYEDKKVLQSPERLLSTRKVISPNSQEKLWRALSSNDMQDDIETKSCREKLVFEKNCEERASSTLSDIKRDRVIFTSKQPKALYTAEVTTNPTQTRKRKDQRKGLHSTGIVKGPRASHFSQRAAGGCSSVQSCSQNAIQFSQQQMHDIERLATKLVKELQSMKEIAVDALHCESRAGAKFKSNMDEVRVAVEHATKVEDTTKKWLSMMTRDCNRFCKIMGLAEAEADAASPEKPAHKERKKIMFADEAGESLCHVKVYEAFDIGMDADTSVESAIENEEALGA